MTVKTVIFVLLFTETSFIYPIFVHVLFRVLYPEKRMKRESGESPEQSRCCKFRKRCINTYATVLEEWEGDTSGISQKTYHAIMFHCFRGKSVESNEPDKSSIISFITLIQRKCVKTNKLCQVYLCVSGRRDFARTLLNSNRLK